MLTDSQMAAAIIDRVVDHARAWGRLGGVGMLPFCREKGCQRPNQRIGVLIRSLIRPYAT